MSKSEAVVWEDPPEAERRYDWDTIASELRANPGKWAKVFDRDRTSLATAIRIRGIKALNPDDGFEVRTANNDRGNPELGIPRTCTLYLRYNPPKRKK